MSTKGLPGASRTLLRSFPNNSIFLIFMFFVRFHGDAWFGTGSNEEIRRPDLRQMIALECISVALGESHKHFPFDATSEGSFYDFA